MENFASGLQLIQRGQAFCIVLSQATWIVKKDVLKLRALIPNLQQLVHLLLVFGEGKAHFGVVDREHAFGGGSILVQRNRNRSQRLHCQHGGIQAWPIRSHHHHMLAPAQASLVQASRQFLHHG